MSRNARGWCVISRTLPMVLFVCASPVVAEVKLPTLAEVVAGMQDEKVSLQGYIGRGPEGGVRFVLPDARDNGFPVDFKSETDLDAAIKGCGFDGSGGLPCKVAATGYLTWEAARLHVVVTSIDSIDPPKAWQ